MNIITLKKIKEIQLKKNMKRLKFLILFAQCIAD